VEGGGEEREREREEKADIAAQLDLALPRLELAAVDAANADRRGAWRVGRCGDEQSSARILRSDRAHRRRGNGMRR